MKILLAAVAILTAALSFELGMRMNEADARVPRDGEDSAVRDDRITVAQSGKGLLHRVDGLSHR